MKTLNVESPTLDTKKMEEQFFDYCNSSIINPNDSSELDALICHYGEYVRISDRIEHPIRIALTKTLKKILELPIRSSVRMLKKFLTLHALFPVQFIEGTRFILIEKILCKTAPSEKRLGVLCTELLLAQDVIPLEFWRSVDFKRNPDLWVFYLEEIIKNDKSQKMSPIIASAPEGMSQESKQKIVSMLETVELEKDSFILSAPAWLAEMIKHKEVA